MMVEQNISDRWKLLSFSATNFNIDKSITIDSKLGLPKMPQTKKINVLVIPTSEDLRNFFKIVKKKKSRK